MKENEIPYLRIAWRLIEKRSYESGLRLETAINIYGPEPGLERWHECEEAHYPGDCELCAMLP
jgi:hypothetical protein